MSGPPAPPGEAARVSARSVLVLAPHYDDEVLGCGGLLVQLATAGAAVRALFLTDSSGGEEEVGDRTAYAAERRAEAGRARELLGLTGAEHLPIPDGQLAARISEAAAAIHRALLTQRPDLVLAPSPLETSADHRAAFAALHRVLAPLRGAELEELGALRILLYEVNHPGYPDLLVDVGPQVALLEKTMAAYASQERRHPYWQAGLGLRRFRAAALGPAVEAAEGYRQLTVRDFATRGAADLVTLLGGIPELHRVEEGPLVTVIVRTKDRPELLAQALRSLDRGAYRRAEIVLVNDGGAPPPLPEELGLPLRRVDLPTNAGRAAAANAGIAAARGDFVAFLDDDDLAEPEHLATLSGLVGAPGVRVAYTDAAVGVYDLDPVAGWRCAERRLPYSRDFDAELLLVDNYIPFNTLLIDRRLLAQVGPFDETLPFFEDWDFLIRLSALQPFHHLAQVTCEYRHFRGGAHHILGERPRQRADFLTMKARIIAKHSARLGPETLARVVDGLRAELVERGEKVAMASAEAAASRFEIGELRREMDELRGEIAKLHREALEQAERYHRLNGEHAALRGDRERLADEARRLSDEAVGHQRDAGALRQELGKRDADLERLYGAERGLRAEVTRLEALVREMRATRAWRAHEWWTRKR